jgi:subtilisin family serine protease
MLNFVDSTETILSADELALFEEVATLVQQTLTAFASGDDFEAIIATVFGDAYDAEALAELRHQWAAGNFEALPEIQILSSDVLGNANGAFSAETGQIYLSEGFIFRNFEFLQNVESVILEEIGHFVDVQINDVDTAGDEGYHFSNVLKIKVNSEISKTQLGENDLDIIAIDDNLVAVEKSEATGTLLTDPDTGLLYESDKLLVKFSPDTTEAEIQSILQRYSIIESRNFSYSSSTLNYTLPGLEQWNLFIFSAEQNVKELSELIANEISVEDVELNYLIEFEPASDPNDTYFDRQWGFNNIGQDIIPIFLPLNPDIFVEPINGTPDADIDAIEAWNELSSLGLEVGSKEIIVAVLDTGVDYNHPDLINNLLINEIEKNGIPNFDDDNNGYIDDIYGIDIVDNDGDPRDELSQRSTDLDPIAHGTVIAGIIGAEGNNSAGITGILQKTSILPIRTLISPDDDETKAPSTDERIEALTYAVARGAKVLNLSFGADISAEPPSKMLRDAYIGLEKEDILLVTAAGNDGLDRDIYPTYPQSYDLNNLIVVANTDHNDDLFVARPGLTSGSSAFGAETVDLGAPGRSIFSTFLYSDDGNDINDYQVVTGSSYAAPMVAGAAALLFAYNPEFPAADVKDIILSSVDKVPSLEGKTVTGGRLNLNKALIEAQRRVEVTLKIDEFNDVGKLDGPLTTPEVFPRGFIGRRDFVRPFIRSSNPKGAQLESWSFSGYTGTQSIDIELGIFDNDAGLRGRDDTSDINPDPNQAILRLRYFLPTDDSPERLVVIDPLGSEIESLEIQKLSDGRYYTDGRDGNNSSELGEIWFTIERSLASEIVSARSTTRLSIGPYYVDPDIDDNIAISRIGGMPTNETIQVTSGDITQEYDAGEEIEGIAGLGNDTITLDGVLTKALLDGGPGNDLLQIINTPSQETQGSQFIGGDGNDTLIGGGGDDRLDGGSGDDFINGGEGIDTVSYRSSDQGIVLNLTTGQVSGDGAGDTNLSIEQHEGSRFDDQIIGDEGDNVFFGIEGNDLLQGLGGSDRLEGGIDADVIDGGEGEDTAAYTNALSGVAVDLGNNSGTQGDAQGDTFISIENLAGSEFADTLVGDEFENFIRGNDGDDVLNGSAGNDILSGDIGADNLIGGAGIDTATYEFSESGVDVNLETGVGVGGDAEGDQLSEIENLIGSGFRDILTGDAGDNVFAPGLSRDNSPRDDVDGGDGIDRLVVDYSVGDTGEGVTGSMGSVRRLIEIGNGRPLDSIQFRNIESIDLTGTRKDDTINTSSSSVGYDDILRGRGGNDTFRSYRGDDILYGDEGDDFLDAGIGNDTVYGGEGNDIIWARSNSVDGSSPEEATENVDFLDGGDGIDTLSVNLANQTVDITLISNSLTDTIAEVALDNGTTIKNFELLEFVHTGSGNDFIVQKGAYSSTIYTGDGDDIIDMGGYGSTTDRVNAGNGNDTVIIDYADIDLGEGIRVTNQGLSPISSPALATIYQGVERFEFIGTQYDDDFRAFLGSPTLAETGALDDVASGGGGNDSLQGFRGNDRLNGDEGDDDLDGGEGQDILNGGIGQDTLAGGDGDDILFLGNDSDQDTVNFQIRGTQAATGRDTIFEFVRGVGGDVLDISGVLQTFYIDVIAQNGNTELRVGEAPNGNVPSNFELGGLLLTLEGVTGFTAADVGVNLVAPSDVIFRFGAAPANQAPIAAGDTFEVNEDTLLNGNVLDDNGQGPDNDPNDDVLTASLLTGVNNGSLTFNADGTFEYIPNPDFNGIDSFTYELSDGELTDNATVNITVNASPADLVATNFDIFTDHVLGSLATFTYALENQGSQDAGAFNVDVVHSNDDIIGNADDSVVTSFEVSGIAAGDTLTGTLDIQLPLEDLNANALAEDPTGQSSGYVSNNVDYVGLVIDPTNVIPESSELNNINRGKGIDKDDITYFPWDIDGNGQVTPADAIFVINRLGQTTTTENASADFDGSGQVTPSDAISVINRLGYGINPDIFEAIT